MSELQFDETKLPWHIERIKAWQGGAKIAPISVDLAIHPGCNFKCTWCYAQLQHQPGATGWTWDMIRHTFDDFSELGVKAVSLVSDGESTLNPLLSDTIRYGFKHGLDMALGTNGYRLDYETLERILPNLTYLRFNISAAKLSNYCAVHGVTEKAYHRVLENIRDAVSIKAERCLRCTIGLQMVFMPSYIDQVMPLAFLGKGLGVDYLVIKHCADDEHGTLGVPYADYDLCDEVLRRAECLSDERYKVIIKWRKIKAGNKRSYSRCLAPPFQLQLSGSGLLAPCGQFFHGKYFRYHIGNVRNTRFKDLWKSDRYWDVMRYLSSPGFDAQRACGCLCLADAANIYLNDLKDGKIELKKPEGDPPLHLNFI